MTAKAKSEVHQFQAEAQQVLDLMTHSLYSNREVFLRELISNASDACDKLRFKAIKDESLYAGDSDLKIRVTIDQEAGTVSIHDNGIGMARAELIENIGTIAHSGTRRFLEKLTGNQKQDAQLIGQFGVGFYSSFVVADRVELTTRKAGGKTATRWSSDGRGEYTLETATDFEGRGTCVTLHLKEDEKEFLEDYRLRGLISKYSDHVAFPIEMRKRATTDEDGKEKDAAPEWEVVNQASALWQRPKADISDDDYQSFYKHVSHDFGPALTWVHNKVEGNQSYTSLLYIPENAPFDLLTSRDQRKGLKLYVKRVFIMDAAEQLLPNYLRFVRGVVDSDDIPLNVSREILQENRNVAKIRSALIKRVLDVLQKMATDDSEKFRKFWAAFGEVFKEGPAEDFANRDKILKLMRFASTHDEDRVQNVTIDDYLSRMGGEQDKIYYITADSYSAAKNSPHLEMFRKKGIEVLLLWDRVDEWMMGYLHEYEGKSFQSVAKGDIDLAASEEDEKARKQAEKQAEDLLKRLQETLKDEVKEVKVSQRLTDSPACLVLDEHDMAMHMQKLMKQAGHEMPGGKPVLEINPEHPLVKRLDSEKDGKKFDEWGMLLFEQAVLSEGGQLDDPARFVQRLNGIMLALAEG